MPFNFKITLTETVERERTATIKLTKKEVVDFYEIPYEEQGDWEEHVESYINDCLPDLQEAGRLKLEDSTDEEVTDTRIDDVEKED